MFVRLVILITAAILFLGESSGSAQRTDGRFDRWDVNKDGKLVREELPAELRSNFDRVDRNGDGFISREEDAAPRAAAQKNAAAPQAPPLPDSVVAHLDLAYARTDNPRQRLDLIVPRKQKGSEPLPVIAFIHGGGWKNGDKTAGIRNVMPYATSGEYAGVSIGYRLSGEAIWPAQIHDCKAAIRWLRAHAKEYNLDANRIAVWGSSAGGHLVAMLGTSGDVPEMNGTLGPHTDQASTVTCVVDFYGPTNFLTMNSTAIPGATMDHDAANSPESQLIGGAIHDNKDKVATANPLTYVTENDAPFLIVHGTEDPLVSFNQSELLRDALRAAKIRVTLVPVTGAGHGGFRNPRVDEVVSLFLQRELLQRDVTVPSDPISQPKAVNKK